MRLSKPLLLAACQAFGAMVRARHVLTAVALALGLLGWASRAEAHGHILITWGSTGSALAPIPLDQREAIATGTAPDVEFGYCFEHFGAFYLDLWSYGGRYCLFNDKLHWPLTDAEVVEIMGAPPASFGKPWRYRLPPLLVVLLLWFALMIAESVRGDREQQELAALLAEPIYQFAVGLMQRANEERRTAAGEGEVRAYLHGVGVDQAAAAKHAKLIRKYYAILPDYRPLVTPLDGDAVS